MAQKRTAKIKDGEDTPVVHFHEHIDVLRPAAVMRDMLFKIPQLGRIAKNDEFFDHPDDGVHGLYICWSEVTLTKLTLTSTMTSGQGIAECAVGD